jgi:hypothetical protein
VCQWEILAIRVTESFQLRLDIVEHISNLWKLQEESHLMENKVLDEADEDFASVIIF